MVDKLVVLFRIKHFKQGRRWITTKIRAHLVDFVEKEQRISHTNLRHVLQDFTRHRPDVRTSVAANLGFVPHAAQ